MLHSASSLRGQEKSFHHIQHYTISKVMIIGEQKYSLLKQQAFTIIREQKLYLTRYTKEYYFLMPLLVLFPARVLELQYLGLFKKKKKNLLNMISQVHYCLKSIKTSYTCEWQPSSK